MAISYITTEFAIQAKKAIIVATILVLWEIWVDPYIMDYISVAQYHLNDIFYSQIPEEATDAIYDMVILFSSIKFLHWFLSSDPDIVGSLRSSV